MCFVNFLQGQVLTFGGGNHVISNNLYKLGKGEREVNRTGKVLLICTRLKTKTKLYLNCPETN